MLDDTRTGLNGAVRQLFARIAPNAVAAPSPRPVIWATDAARPARATASPPPTPPAGRTPTPATAR